MKRIITLLVIATACLTSCTEDLAKEYSISLESTRLSFDSEGGKQQVSLESTYEWEVYGGDYWCSVSPQSGEGDAEVVFTIDPNMAEDGRSAEFVFTSGNKKTTLTVTQEKKEYSISIEPKELKFGSKGGEQEITVTSSDEWEVKGESDWCDISVTSGNNGDKVTFTADPYENTTDERSATFTFHCGNKNVDLIVTQEAKVYSISVEPKELTFEAEGGEKQITIMSSENWHFGFFANSYVPGEFITSWIKLSEYEGENGTVVTVTLKHNHTPYVLYTDIIFICGDKEAKVTVTQQADDSPIIQFKDPYFLDALLQTYTVTWNNENYKVDVDKNNDGQVSESEAADVEVLDLYEAQRQAGNKIRNIDELKYFAGLKCLSFRNCNIENVTLSNSKLEELILYSTNGEGKIKTLNIDKCIALKKLDCHMNELTSLNINGCSALTDLYCMNNQLISLDLSNNKALTDLYCSSNQLTSLDLSNNKALINLECENNQLTSLDLSNNTALTDLKCYRNDITSLDLSKCTKLYRLYCVGFATSGNYPYSELSYIYPDTKCPLESLKIYKYHIIWEISMEATRQAYESVIEYVE